MHLSKFIIVFLSKTIATINYQRKKLAIKMTKIKQMHLKQSSILTVPLNTYENDFSFIVNGQEFKTNRFIADLLSPVICRIHSSDPTITTYTINTKYNGDFSRILKLVNFEMTNITDDEIPFLSEVIENIGKGCIEFDFNIEAVQLTVDNVLSCLQEHEKYQKFYRNLISKEIEFVSSHFTEICENQEEEMKKLSLDTLICIASNEKLKLKSEDQLLKFINELYSNNSEYSILYETVLFTNVSSEMMKEFVSVFDANDMSIVTWDSLSKRLCYEIENNDNEKNRYSEEQNHNKYLTFEYTKEKEYKGIFNYIQTQSGGKIENEINFTSSSLWDSSYHPSYVTIFGDQNQTFRTRNEKNCWICFDFKDHRVIPTHYTIRSRNWAENNAHPKSWVIEGSDDDKTWEIVDEENNCSFLNGNSLAHTFTMNHSKTKKFRYIKMRSTGPDWRGQKELAFESFEIYGKFI